LSARHLRLELINHFLIDNVSLIDIDQVNAWEANATAT
jgi:hypothetical protein